MHFIDAISPATYFNFRSYSAQMSFYHWFSFMSLWDPPDLCCINLWMQNSTCNLIQSILYVCFVSFRLSRFKIGIRGQTLPESVNMSPCPVRREKCIKSGKSHVNTDENQCFLVSNNLRFIIMRTHFYNLYNPFSKYKNNLSFR